MKTVGIQVRRAFARAAAAYDDVADYQRETGRQLLAQVDAAYLPNQVIDVGCGTGHGVHLLRARWPDVQVAALDFALDMTRRLPANAQRICGDAEALPLRGESFDLFWSNLTLQWCDPLHFAGEAARVLRPGGRAAVSTLGPLTFTQLRTAFDGVDRYRHTIDFPPTEDVESAFRKAGLQVTTLHRAVVFRHYPDVPTLLRAVRQLGANRVTGSNRRPGLMGRRAWQHFVENYERQRVPSGLPLGYDTVLICAEKP